MSALLDHMAMMRQRRREVSQHKQQNKKNRQENLMRLNLRKKDELIQQLRAEIAELHLTIDHLRHILQEISSRSHRPLPNELVVQDTILTSWTLHK